MKNNQTLYVLLSIATLCGIMIFAVYFMLTQVDAAFGHIALSAYIYRSISRFILMMLCVVAYCRFADKLEV